MSAAREITDVSVLLAARGTPRRPGKPAEKRQSDAAAPSDALSVLVVDDVEDAREMYRRFLDFHGMRVVTAPDGLAALQAVSVEAPDVIVLDLAMPRVSGWEAIRTLKRRARTRTIPIIALSGQGTRESALNAGADSFLEKPCLPHELLAEVLRLVDEPGRRRRDQ